MNENIKFSKIELDYRKPENDFLKIYYLIDNSPTGFIFKADILSALNLDENSTDEEIIEITGNLIEKEMDYLRTIIKPNFDVMMIQKKAPNIILTDIQFHTSYNQNKKSFERNVDRSIKNKQPGRFYFNSKNFKINENGTFEMIIPIENLDKYNISMVKDMPLMAGQDTMEKINSIKSK